jgi:hypothetical protein
MALSESMGISSRNHAERERLLSKERLVHLQSCDLLIRELNHLAGLIPTLMFHVKHASARS